MQATRFIAIVLATGAVLALAGCGGGGNGGNQPIMGQPQMYDFPLKWVDVDGNGAINTGDRLLVQFDRPVTATGAAAPGDLAVSGGSSVGATATWADGPGVGFMTINLTGAGVAITLGPDAGGTTINLMAANQLVNPNDAGAGAALPAMAAQYTMANVTNSGQGMGAGTTWAVAIANVNNNAMPDIVFGQNGRNEHFINDGSGTFAAGPAWQGEGAGRSTYGLALIDNDGDDRIDTIVTANGSIAPRENFVYDVDGTVNPADPTMDHSTAPADQDFVVLGNDDTRGIAVGQFNSGDPLPNGLDVVCANLGQMNVIYFSNGAGRFEGSAAVPDLVGVRDPQTFQLGATLNDTVAVAAAQLDAALSDDFVTLDQTGGGVFTAWTVNGTGTPTARPSIVVGADPRCVALGDLNGAGGLDAAVGLGSMGGIRLLTSDGAANFTLLAPILGAGTDTVGGIAIADVDGDGDNDIIAGNDSSQPNKVWLNTGAMTFVDSTLRLGTASTFGVAASRTPAPPFAAPGNRGVDNIGEEDFATANAGNANALWWTAR